MKNTLRFICVLLLSGGLSTSAYSQCNGFTKKKCMPLLKPFVHNGQMNSASLVAGEAIEMLMTFNPNQDYRIAVCGEADLGAVQFIMMDTNKKIIYSSKDHDNKPTWDFNVKTIQQITVKVVAPPSNSPHHKNGCVAVLVGFKKK